MIHERIRLLKEIVDEIASIFDDVRALPFQIDNRG